LLCAILLFPSKSNHDSILSVTAELDSLPDDINALRAALAAEQLARREAEARASGAEAMIAHLKLMIAKLRHDRFGASSERGRKLLDQLELELEEAEAAASEVETGKGEPNTPVRPFTRRKPVRGPLPEHLPRERVVLPGPSACPCCGGRLAKLGETITETPGSHPPSLEGGADGAGEILLSFLRDDHPAARALPPDRARSGWTEPSGDDHGSEVRPASAAEPAERDLRPRGHRA
jgi:hypothetical protein